MIDSGTGSSIEHPTCPGQVIEARDRVFGTISREIGPGPALLVFRPYSCLTTIRVKSPIRPDQWLGQILLYLVVTPPTESLTSPFLA